MILIDATCITQRLLNKKTHENRIKVPKRLASLWLNSVPGTLRDDQRTSLWLQVVSNHMKQLNNKRSETSVSVCLILK